MLRASGTFAAHLLRLILLLGQQGDDFRESAIFEVGLVFPCATAPVPRAAPRDKTLKRLPDLRQRFVFHECLLPQWVQI